MEEIKTGLSYISEMIITPELSASALGSGDMNVLATPAMVALMENASMLCVAPLIETTQTTVGIFIETSHSRATPVGKRIEATAIITAVDGRKISFDVVAKDDKGVIGSAKHDRFIVDREKFLSRL